MTVACVVRSSVDCNVMALTTQSSSVIFGKIVRTPDALLNIYVFVETCGTDKSCGNSCCECSVQCVCVLLHLGFMLFHFSDIVCFLLQIFRGVYHLHH